MRFDSDTLWRFFVMGLTDPREAASQVLSLGLPMRALWPLCGLIALALAVLMFLQSLFLGMPEITQSDGTPQSIQISPLLFAGVAYLFLTLYAWAIAALGRQLGGTGLFQEAFALVIYLQAVLLAFQLAELLLTMVGLGALGAIVGIGAFFFGFYLNIVFVDVLHGYGSMMKSFLLLIAVSAAFAIALMTILTLSGVRFG